MPDIISGGVPHRGDLFLYLTKAEWATSWINGGSIPLSKASDYLAAEQSGTMTPDEVKQRQSVGLGAEIADAVDLDSVGSVWMTNCTVNGLHGRSGQVHTAQQDSWILCFSNNLSVAIRDELKKPADGGAVVKISDPHVLLRAIDQQMGVQGHLAAISYTDSIDRSTFVKGLGSRAQREVRMAWDIVSEQPKMVEIPAGTAELVDLATCQEIHIAPTVFRTEGRSLFDFFGTHRGSAELGAAHGDPDWKAELKKLRRQDRAKLLSGSSLGFGFRPSE